MNFMPTSHTNRLFNEALGEIGAELTELANLTRSALEQSCEALIDGDAEKALKIAGRDHRLNELESGVSMKVATTIARHQPVAHDLHALMGSVQMAVEFERLADHAKNIGKRMSWIIRSESELAFREQITELGRQTLEMLNQFLDASSIRDYDRAAEVWRMDERNNKLYHEVMEKAMTSKLKNSTPRSLINSLFIAKNFERIGDKIKNLSEIAYYQKTGQMPDFEHEEEDYKDSY